MKTKKAAMEMSIGTIVVIVLAMSMLILGIVLVRNIFSSGTSAVDASHEQVMDQISQMFGNDKKVGIVPTTGKVEIKQGTGDGFRIAIQNLERGSDGQNARFSYEVVVSEIESGCSITEQEINDWMLGSSESDMAIPVGESDSPRVILNVPDNAELCTFLLRANVFINGNPYGVERIEVSIVA